MRFSSRKIDDLVVGIPFKGVAVEVRDDHVSHRGNRTKAILRASSVLLGAYKEFRRTDSSFCGCDSVTLL